MISFALSLTVLITVLWLIWRLVRPYLLKSPLDNVPGPKPCSWVTGDMVPLFDRLGGWKFNQDLTEKYGSVVRLQGLLGSRVLYVSDPVALNHVMIKDATAYEQPAYAYAANKITFGPGLLSVGGEQHRRQRRILNPIFSDNNMREMTPIFYKITYKLREAITAKVHGSACDIDVLHWMSRTALEVIAQAGLGHTFDPLTPGLEAPNDVALAIKSVVPVTFALSLWRMFCSHFEKLGSPQFRRWLANVAVLLPDANLKRLKWVIETMDEAAKDIFRIKKAALKIDGSQAFLELEGPDIMDTLLKKNAQFHVSEALSEDELLAQISTMMFSGTETTSGALARVLQALAEHPDVQHKLREELVAARHLYGPDIPYDQLTELPILDAVCCETLRLYSPVSFAPRENITDVVMPLLDPIKGLDGHDIDELFVPKGTLVMLSYAACNTSRSVWGDDVLEWKPQRWLSPLPSTVIRARIPGVYSNLMTFGGGGRACIGFRFSQLEMKVILSVLVVSFRFSPTTEEIVWNFAGIHFPSMAKDSIEPSLRLHVESFPSASDVV